MINIRHNIATFRYDERLFPVWWTTKMMASFASYLITGSVLTTCVCTFIIGCLVCPLFWLFIIEQWQYVVGYFTYLFIEHIVIRYCIYRKFDVANKYKTVFQGFLNHTQKSRYPQKVSLAHT